MVTDESLAEAVNEVFENRETYIQAMENAGASDAIQIIVNLCNEAVRDSKNKKRK